MDTQPASKKRRVVRLSAVVEMHVEPHLHNLYATATTNGVAAEALQVITEAVAKAEKMLYTHNSKVTSSGAKTDITQEMVNISTTVDSQQWTRQQ